MEWPDIGIISGPITSSGNYPFKLKRSDILLIKSKFSKFKIKVKDSNFLSINKPHLVVSTSI